MNLFKKVLIKYKNHGFNKTNALIINHLKLHYQLYKEKKFDLKYGIETRHHILPKNLKVESKNKQDACSYAPIHINNFYASMKDLNIRYEDYIFIDVGAGKGRALLLAFDFPYKELIGIEFSKEIYDIATDNINKFKSIHNRSHNFKLLYMDATQYSFPEENIVLFLYNPFHGQVLKNFIENLRKHAEMTEKDFIIIYHYPMFSDLYDEQNFLELKISTNEYNIYELASNNH